MPIRKRCLHFFVLLLFGFLSVKNILGPLPGSSTQDCHEFGHIHQHKTKSNLQTNELMASDSDPTDDCHGGQMFSTGFILPKNETEPKIEPFLNVFAVVATLSTTAPSPNIEPHKKPPKAS